MVNRKQYLSVLSLLVAFILTIGCPVFADDITDSIQEALKAYEEGEFTDAVESLNYASQLIQQKKGEGLEKFLPEPLSGWTAQAPASQAAGAALFGGGITAERTYRKANSTIFVKMMADSPVMQGMLAMFSNPMIAASGGGKLERIGRQKVITKYDPSNNRGDIQTVVANRYLITIEGRQASLEDMKAYAKAIEYKKIAKLP